ncbi:APOBEC1 complementation factor-like [Asbolus verrucosus]|uniref:APOBEC1 complementation factor-like n=1 Tax=Asbolus verrucosus TaxID=1661398 RepID=A0A482VJ00_ASBVE|nr:APOBEC1 complementation factor-like [Asbolus verrucosus]
MSGKKEIAESKYPVIQSNGQRIYFPYMSDKNVAAPPRGSEVFVGNLPRDLFEDELVPLFSQVDLIYKVRLMMDFSGSTRGFAFVQYHTIEAANKAIERFNNYPIRKKRNGCARITVHISLDNCRLFFGNIPKGKSSEAIEAELRNIIDGIEKVFVYAERKNPRLNRGFAFVEFESHAMAAIARRKLLSGIFDLWGNEDERICVDWAEPEPIVNPAIMKRVKILYFRNVPVSWSPDRFKSFANRILKNIVIERIYKKDNYAFVHFFTRNAAEMAMKMLESEFLIFHGREIEVEWARPVGYSRQHRGSRLPDNLCIPNGQKSDRSVPPKVRKIIQKSKKKIIKISSAVSSNGSCSHSSSDSSDLFTEIDINLEKKILILSK